MIPAGHPDVHPDTLIPDVPYTGLSSPFIELNSSMTGVDHQMVETKKKPGTKTSDPKKAEPKKSELKKTEPKKNPAGKTPAKPTQKPKK